MSTIPLYTFSTPTHRVMRDEWLLPSVDDEAFEVRNHDGEQLSSTGTYYSDHWRKTMIAKVEVILKAIEEQWGEVFVYSDVDIQFFGLMPAYILDTLEDCDIAFQKNDRYDRICAGFFACKANDATKKFWTAVKTLLLENQRSDDQDCAQFLLLQNTTFAKIAAYLRMLLEHDVAVEKNARTNARFNLRWRIFGRQIYLPEKHWEPGDPLDVPDDILVHHANWTVGIGNKIAQLRYVRDLVESRAKNAAA